MTKVHRCSPFILALALLATAAFLILGVLRPSEADNDSAFVEKVAGTYLVTREPAEGPSRILTIHADGSLSSIQSIQFSEGAGPEGFVGFSNQHGAWEKAGNQQIEAIVLDFIHDLSDGTFLGTTGAHYVLEFGKDFQTIEGTVKGKIFAPGGTPYTQVMPRRLLNSPMSLLISGSALKERSTNRIMTGTPTPSGLSDHRLLHVYPGKDSPVEFRGRFMY